MPLINCKECNNLISEKALNCPHCGYKHRHDKSGCILASGCTGTLMIIIIILVIIIISILHFAMDLTSALWDGMFG